MGFASDKALITACRSVGWMVKYDSDWGVYKARSIKDHATYDEGFEIDKQFCDALGSRLVVYHQVLYYNRLKGL